MGLQNGLVGSEKDLGEGEVMNLMVVAAGGPEVLRRRSDGEKERAASEGVVQVVAWHNHIMDQARIWTAAMADGEYGKNEVTEDLFMVVATHYPWASKAKRYSTA